MSRRPVLLLVAGCAMLVGVAVMEAPAADANLPSISVGDAAAPEGPLGEMTAVTVAVTLSSASASTVSVQWTTADGTASRDDDYTPASGTVAFPPGSTTGTIEVEISGGNNPEWNEYFTIFLFNPVNGTIARAIGKVTILNDDGDPPGLPPGAANVAPAGGSGQCVALNNGQGCQPLSIGQQIALDSIRFINPRAGKVELSTSEGVSSFYGGRFDVDQINQSETVSRSIIVVRLVGGSFKSCRSGNRSLSSAGGAEAKKKPIRRLWGKGKGRFRTRGRYASGTVRGTNWVTEDYCDGTRIRVVAGVVQIYDLVRKRWVTLKSGESYFSPAKKSAKPTKTSKRSKKP